jgi:hypothetical protein
MRQDVATLLLLVLVLVEGLNAPQEVIETLLKAQNVQKDLLSLVRSDVTMSSSSEVVEGERLALGDICEKVGVAYMDGGDKFSAEVSLRESIQHNPHNVKALLGLAKLHRLVLGLVGELGLALGLMGELVFSNSIPATLSSTTTPSLILILTD